MKKLLLGFLALFLMTQLHSQDNQHTIKLDYINQNWSYFSFGYANLHYKTKELITNSPFSHIEKSYGASLAADIKLHKDFNMFLSIAYEYSRKFIFLKFKSGIITDFKKIDYFVSPQLGITILSEINIYGGYNFTLKNRFGNKGPLVGIGINI